MIRSAQKTFAKAFAKDEDGATAIEYGLIAALVGAAIVGSVCSMGQSTNSTFGNVSKQLDNPSAAASN